MGASSGSCEGGGGEAGPSRPDYGTAIAGVHVTAARSAPIGPVGEHGAALEGRDRAAPDRRPGRERRDDPIGGAVRSPRHGHPVAQCGQRVATRRRAPPGRRATAGPVGQLARNVDRGQVFGHHLGVGQQVDEADVLRLDERAGRPRGRTA